jgi:hypothetical protein
VRLFPALLLIGALGFGQRLPSRPSKAEIPITRKSKASTDLEQLDGFVRSVDATTLVVQNPDSRTLEFALDDQTIRPKSLKPGDWVEVDAAQNDKGVYVAHEIRRKTPPKGVTPPPAPSQPAAAAGAGMEEPREIATTVVKPQVRFEEGEAPPRLRRGIPAPRKPSKESAGNDAGPAPPPVETRVFSAEGRLELSEPADPAMALLERARAESESFLEGLPNYICRQLTTRYAGEGKPVSWRALDVVTADLVFEDGKEKYQNLAVNGKPLKGRIEDTGGWSTGEFGTVLRDLFSPSTDASFKFAGGGVVQRQPATQYDFTVERTGSHWHIGVPGQFIEPAYKGAIWVARESGRVLRIEMQAREIPKEFPKDTTELAIDYDWVMLAGRKFLLPVKSEVLTCTRGASQCEKNTIEFRNYRKFVGQSDIIFK